MPHDKYTTLHRIFSRLCFEAGVTPEQYGHARERFVSKLFSYPEDLICAAYHYISHHSPSRFPTEEEFIRFMAPEFARRMGALEEA